MKTILGTYSAPPRHWVGNGFPVRSLFSYQSHGRHVSPFLLLDHAGPMDFEPATRPRGVGEHPHRGFETVTIVLDGEVEHADSTGAGGVIGPGDVQWMTAGAGILHEEFHSRRFTRTGGRLEMVQLWVNLPSRYKMTAPGYQHLGVSDIPEIALPDAAGRLRVIAGEYAGQPGPARTFSPMQVWDLRLERDGEVRLDLPHGWNSMLVVLHGTVQVNGSEIARGGQLVMLSAEHEGVIVESNNDATVLVLSGEPIDEPVVGQGPFVMNTPDEIRQAIRDYREGRLQDSAPST
ncbi:MULTISPECIES: pirin family protein [unclassified Thioalkalivibrio]|uniref:pirin family protein n=1 Tax=unclassified Thioalkalivibrio TaxID=2621013 RepID=UPI0003600B8A|nr:MULTISPECIES: pirin family protein [unclassified Thioalkalivibrio]